MMNIKTKRKAGKILDRGGISQRIIQLAKDISKGTYKNAIEKAGQISVLVDAATYDEYWDEKASIGKGKECYILSDLIDGKIKTESLISHSNPYQK